MYYVNEVNPKLSFPISRACHLQSFQIKYYFLFCFAFSGELIPDSKVRVSTKTLAIGCLTNAIAMTPKVFLLTLFSDDEEEDTKTILIRDVANFSEHEDPQLRGLILFVILLKVGKSNKVFSVWSHLQRNAGKVDGTIILCISLKMRPSRKYHLRFSHLYFDKMN